MSFSQLGTWTEDVEKMQRKFAGATTLEEMLKLAGQYDSVDKNASLEYLWNRIDNKFQGTFLFPTLEDQGLESSMEESEVISMINSSEKGYIYSKLRRLLMEYLESPYYNSKQMQEYLYLFIGYFPTRVSYAVGGWKVQFSSLLKEPEVASCLVPEPQSSIQEKVNKLLGGYGHRMDQEQHVEYVILSCMGQEEQVSRNRLLEDQAALSLVDRLIQKKILPFKEKEIDLRNGGTFSLLKTHEFRVESSEGITILKEDVRSVQFVVKVQETRSVSIGSASVKYTQKIHKECHQKKVDVISIPNSAPSYPHFILSTDSSAYVQAQTESCISICHRKEGEVFNILRELPSSYDTPAFFQDHRISAELGDIRHLFRFLRAYMITSRPFNKVEAVCNRIKQFHPKALGKLLFMLGFLREEGTPSPYWSWSCKSLKKLSFHFLLEYYDSGTLRDRLQSMYIETFGAESWNFYLQSERKIDFAAWMYGLEEMVTGEEEFKDLVTLFLYDNPYYFRSVWKPLDVLKSAVSHQLMHGPRKREDLEHALVKYGLIGIVSLAYALRTMVQDGAVREVEGDGCYVLLQAG